ncbi:hypothetical protein QQ045_003860 [Rhodiola kirilowii]
MQMARVEGEKSYVNGIPISWPMDSPPSAMLCHYCNSTAAVIFCRNHSAFLCINCDYKVHVGGDSDHHRVLVCELCQRAPAAVTCKADAASLCVHCDAEIHNANPLSRRHQRVSVSPLPNHQPALGDEVPWMDLDQKSKLALCPNEVKSEDFFFPDFDPLIDFDQLDVVFKQEIISCSDGVVPMISSSIASFESVDNYFNIDVEKPNNNIPIYGQPAGNTIQTVPSSSIEAPPTVPNLSSLTKSVGDQAATQQVSGTDREARVLRYKEKRKTRKFEKTIRYATRKAYAETRPRIKGRFAKQNNNDPDIISDLTMFDADRFTYVDDLIYYGVVPTLF